jgi:hypothetical protein
LPPSGTALAPGRYTRSSFEPALSFEVGDGWTAEHQPVGFFDIQQDVGSLDVIAVQFGNTTADSADALAAAIAGRENLSVSEPEPVTIGGQEGIRLVVETTDPPDSDPPIFRDVMNVVPGPLAIASARRLQVNLFDVEDGVLAILIGGSIAEWDRTLEVATPVIESITFD